MADFKSSRPTGKDSIAHDEDFLADSSGFSLSTRPGDVSTEGLSVTTDALEDQEMEELEAFLEDFDRQDGQAAVPTPGPGMGDDLEFLDEPEPDDSRFAHSAPAGDEPPNEPNEEWVVSEIGAAEEWMATKTEIAEPEQMPPDMELSVGEPPLLEPEPDLDLDSDAHYDEGPHFAELDGGGPSADPHKLAELDLSPPAAVAATRYSGQGARSKDELYDSDYFASDEGGERPGGSGSRRGGFALVLAGLGLIAAVAALLLTLRLEGEAAVLDARIEALEQRGGVATGTPTPSGRLGVDIGSLESRVEALAARLDAGLPAAQPEGMNEVQQREMGRLAVQLGSMEARLTELDKGLSALAQRAPGVPAAALNAPAERADAPAPSAKGAQPTPAEEWAVNLVSLSDQKAAADELKRLRESGIAAEIEKISRDGRTWHRLRVLNFDNEEAARRFVTDTASKAGYGDAWVGRR